MVIDWVPTAPTPARTNGHEGAGGERLGGDRGGERPGRWDPRRRWTTSWQGSSNGVPGRSSYARLTDARKAGACLDARAGIVSLDAQHEVGGQDLDKLTRRAFAGSLPTAAGLLMAAAGRRRSGADGKLRGDLAGRVGVAPEGVSRRHRPRAPDRPLSARRQRRQPGATAGGLARCDWPSSPRWTPPGSATKGGSISPSIAVRSRPWPLRRPISTGRRRSIPTPPSGAR